MFERINKLLKKLKTSEKGQSILEYFLIVAFVAAVVMVAFNNGLRSVIVDAFKPGENIISEALDDMFSDGNEEPPAEETPEEPPAEEST